MRRVIAGAIILSAWDALCVALKAAALRKAREAAPHVFDGALASASVAMCLEEYKREFATPEHEQPWNQSPWLNTTRED